MQRQYSSQIVGKNYELVGLALAKNSWAQNSF